MVKASNATPTPAQQAALLQSKAQRLLTQAGQLQQKAAKLQQQAKELIGTKTSQSMKEPSPGMAPKKKRKRSKKMTQDAVQRIQATAQHHPESSTAQSQFDIRAQEASSVSAWDDDDWWDDDE